ncbi:hypothetical protein MMC27_006423 [Xylographa pallens]|nr:hypothetical protein [Xylographa pallens]
MPAFKYEKLNPKVSEIRLVRLSLTDVFTDDIELEIFRISLSDLDHEPYVPLSYTWGMPCHGMSPDWGDPTRTSTVSLNGKSYEIRLSLESALRHIRGVKKNNLPLWIDAVCIDQTNIPERNSQVRLMRQIYERGSYTIIWLGPAQEGSKLALYKIEEVANARREQFFTLLEKDRMAGLVAIIEAVGTDSECWLAIRQVLSCVWWSRAWVFQEAVVSSHAVLLCGFDSASISDVMETLTLMSDIATEQADNSSHVTGSEIVNQAWVLENAMSLLRLWGPYQETSPDASAIDLRDALFLVRRLDATDPRDKIYAALGLVKGSSTIIPDYSRGVGEVYRSFARQYIEEHQTIDLLEECSLSADDIVSWAPNYSRKIYGHILEKHSERDRSIRLYNASRGKSAKFSFSDDSKTLTLVGCYSDPITAVGPKWKFSNASNILDATYKGDVVCVVLGGEVPYVIRPKKNGHYLFVGECYVHGLMDGQALQGYEEGNVEMQIILD